MPPVIPSMIKHCCMCAVYKTARTGLKFSSRLRILLLLLLRLRWGSPGILLLLFWQRLRLKLRLWLCFRGCCRLERLLLLLRGRHGLHASVRIEQPIPKRKV